MGKNNWKKIFIAQGSLLSVLFLGVLFKMGIIPEFLEYIKTNNVFAEDNSLASAEVIPGYDYSYGNEANTSYGYANVYAVNKSTFLSTKTKENKVVEQNVEQVKDNRNEVLRVFKKAEDDKIKEIELKYKDKIVDSFFTVVTSYNSEVGQTDDSPCIAAKGLDLCERDVEDIVATNDFPIHTKIMIPEYFGDRIFYVEDRMNKRYTGTNRIDIWMKKKIDSKSWGGKYNVKILVMK